MKDEQLVISINEFRKLVGREADKLSDAQIEKLILDLDYMAGMYIKAIRKEGSKMQ